MNLHITPSFNIDRLCKTASVLLFLVYFFNKAYFKIEKPRKTNKLNIIHVHDRLAIVTCRTEGADDHATAVI